MAFFRRAYPKSARTESSFGAPLYCAITWDWIARSTGSVAAFVDLATFTALLKPARAAVDASFAATSACRNACRAAGWYVDSRPGLHKAFGWLIQTQRGASYADIAAREQCSPKRAACGSVLLVAAFLLVYLMVRALHGYVNDQATDPNTPKPTPTIVAPPAPPPAPAPTTPPELSADDLRTRGLAECDAGKWTECYGDLSSASVLDPRGETPRTKAALAKAGRILAGKES